LLKQRWINTLVDGFVLTLICVIFTELFSAW